MIFPEQLFQLSPRDQQVTWLDPLIREITTAPAAADPIDQTLTVPQDRILVLTALHMLASPGAAQNVVIMQLSLRPESDITQRITLRQDRIAGAVDTIKAMDWQGEVLVPAGWHVAARGDFNAGVAANQVILHVFGMLIPAGNVQRV